MCEHFYFVHSFPVPSPPDMKMVANLSNSMSLLLITFDISAFTPQTVHLNFVSVICEELCSPAVAAANVAD